MTKTLLVRYGGTKYEVRGTITCMGNRRRGLGYKRRFSFGRYILSE